jgi:hypothetical protein
VLAAFAIAMGFLGVYFGLQLVLRRGWQRVALGSGLFGLYLAAVIWISEAEGTKDSHGFMIGVLLTAVGVSTVRWFWRDRRVIAEALGYSNRRGPV